MPTLRQFRCKYHFLLGTNALSSKISVHYAVRELCYFSVRRDADCGRYDFCNRMFCNGTLSFIITVPTADVGHVQSKTKYWFKINPTCLFQAWLCRYPYLHVQPINGYLWCAKRVSDVGIWWNKLTCQNCIAFQVHYGSNYLFSDVDVLSYFNWIHIDWNFLFTGFNFIRKNKSIFKFL